MVNRRRNSSMPGRRTIPTRGQRRQEHDPNFFVLTAQLALCGVLGLLCYAAADADAPAFADFTKQYREMVTAESVDLPVSLTLPELSYEYGQAADTVGRFVAALAGKNPPAQTVAAENLELDGAGGWMGVPDQTSGKLLPENCTALPILLSAATDAPTSGKVTSPYGLREHPITEAEDFHRGVDIAAALGSPIRAVLPGTVTETGFSQIYGNYITLTHANGLTTTYCHCAELVAAEGARLRRGELVATVGNTGVSTGPHVHFELAKDGVYYNPAWVLDGMKQDGV